MRDIEKDFLARSSKYIVLKEIGDSFTGTFVKVNTTPITKVINGVEDTYLRYEFLDDEGEKKFLDTKSRYQINALAKFQKGDSVTITAINVVDEKDPSKKVKRLSFVLADGAQQSEEVEPPRPRKPIEDKDIPIIGQDEDDEEKTPEQKLKEVPFK